VNDRLTELLIELVDTPSVTGDESAICDLLHQRLGGNRIGNSLVVGSPDDRPMVLLVGHTDTVPPQGQGRARIADGRLHGLGSTDMKSGVAVVVDLLETADIKSYNPVGIFYAGEEGPSDTDELEMVLDELPWLRDAFCSFVLEPSDLEVQAGCNGVANADVTFVGVSAHSSRPWLGENAITKAGRWMSEMHVRKPQPVTIDGLEFVEVMSVTTATGGLASNIIPPSFTLNLNYRFPPNRTPAEAEAILLEAAQGADRVEVTDIAPAGPVELAHPLVARLVDATGRPPKGKQGWTDVARLAARGIPAVNYGPGEVVLAHKPEESVRLSDLVEVRRVIEELLR